MYSNRLLGSYSGRWSAISIPEKPDGRDRKRPDPSCRRVMSAIARQRSHSTLHDRSSPQESSLSSQLVSLQHCVATPPKGQSAHVA
jgi:hypothetical protein